MWPKLKFAAVVVQIFAVLCTSALAQGVPIGALPTASLPLSGSEYTILSQNGTTVKSTVNSFFTPGLTIAANTLLGNNTGAAATATGLTVTQVQTMLGLGTAAFRNIGTSSTTVPLLSGVNTWSGLQTFTGGIALTGGLTVDTLAVTGTTRLGTATASPLIVTSTGISANIASGAGTIELNPFNGTVNLTGGMTISTGLTVSSNGISVTGGLQVNSLGATITGNSQVTGNFQVLSGSFTASGGAAAISPNNANVVISPVGTGVVTINPATAGTMNNMAIGGSTALSGTFTALTGTGAVSLSPANANVTISPTGTGTVTLSPSTAGTLNNIVIGGVTPLASTFTTSTANSFIPNSATLPARGIYLPAANTVGVAGNSLNIASFVGVASASRGLTFTNSNGGNPTIDVTAGSLAITPATVFASTTSATTVTASAGLTLSGAASPITLNGSAGTSTNVLTSAGAGATPTWSAAATTFMTWQGVKTTNFNAAANSQYCVDTQTTGAVTMTLSATPTDGDKVQFIDCKGYFATVNLTIARNGKNIMGLAADMTVAVNNASSTLVYVSANNDWRMY